jgi:STAS-like domain of unknown function (DUF4325)
MIEVKIFDLAGSFAENKDIAQKIRVEQLIPALAKGEDSIVIDFKNVTGATQSFVHALISELIRKYDSDVFTRVIFKNCNASVEQIVNIVADYMEESKYS